MFYFPRCKVSANTTSSNQPPINFPLQVYKVFVRLWSKKVLNLNFKTFQKEIKFEMFSCDIFKGFLIMTE